MKTIFFMFSWKKIFLRNSVNEFILVEIIVQYRFKIEKFDGLQWLLL